MMAPSQMAVTTSIDLAADTIRAVFANVTAPGTTYTFSQAHEFFSDLTLAALTGNSGQSPAMSDCPPLLSKTSNVPAVAVFDAANTLFTPGAAATANEPLGDALILFKDTGVTTTSPLIAYIDGFTAVTFNGGTVTIVWDTGANAIFKLVA